MNWGRVIPNRARTCCPVRAKTVRRMKPARIAVLKALLLSFAPMFLVRLMKIGRFPRGSTITKEFHACPR